MSWSMCSDFDLQPLRRSEKECLKLLYSGFCSMDKEFLKKENKKWQVYY